MPDSGNRDPETTLALAHALRTPLTSLALGLGLLEDGVLGALGDAQREVVRTLVAEVGRLTLLEGSRLPIVWGAPLGDNMMTGTAGLLASVRRLHKRITAA